LPSLKVCLKFHSALSLPRFKNLVALIFERHRRGIFVEPHPQNDQAPSGAAWQMSLLTELELISSGFYKDFAPTALGHTNLSSWFCRTGGLLLRPPSPKSSPPMRGLSPAVLSGLRMTAPLIRRRVFSKTRKQFLLAGEGQGEEERRRPPNEAATVLEQFWKCLNNP